MRSGVLLSLALGLFSAESLASPCKPQSGSSSVVTVSSATSTSVTSSDLSLSSTVTETSSAETETETSKATRSSATTEVASSTESATAETASTTVSSADSTTVSTESTTAVSSTESATSASATESVSSASVTESATSGSATQSTTESEESSTSEAASTCATPNPNPAFKAVVQGSEGSQVMNTNGQHASNIVLDIAADDYSSMGFTIEPCTNYLRQTNGKYVCVNYGTSDYFPPVLVSCQLPAINWFRPLRCEQPVAGQPLVCTAPRGECTPGCHETGGTPFSQFYSKASPDPFQPATFLYFGNSVEEGVPETYTAVDFVAQPYDADPPAPTE